LLSSLLVSLTLTPATSHWILKGVYAKKAKKGRPRKIGCVLRTTQALASWAIRFSLKFPGVVLSCAIGLGLLGLVGFLRLDRDFMPPFNEGAIQVNFDLSPGASLETSSQIATRLASQLIQVDGIDAVVRKTGRSEMDEHAVPVNTSEFICSVDSNGARTFNEIADDVRATIDAENVPGALSSFDQPLQHLINHLRSGTSAKIAIKLNGENLSAMRRSSEEIKEALEDVDDAGTLRVDPIQIDLPQVQIRLKRDALARYGLTPEDVDRTISVALNGSVATTALEGERPVDVLARLGTKYREDLELLRRLPIRLPEKNIAVVSLKDGEERTLSDALLGTDSEGARAVVPLSDVAEIDVRALGAGQIDRENSRRQVTIQSNPRRRGAVEVKEDIEKSLQSCWSEITSNGVDVRITGLFESEAEATRTLLALSCLSALAIFLVLYKTFRSANLALQVMAIVPLALVGAVGALWLTGQSRTIPALIGMISLCGVASRNGILLIERYLHLAQYEGAELTQETILRAGKERVAPVLMTALTSAIGLAPLAAAPNLPGREILYPITTVMIGGLLTSTALEFFVRPALFWTFGLEEAKRCVKLATSKSELSEKAPKFSVVDKSDKA